MAWLLLEPGGSTSSSKWLYNILLVGSAFVCLKSPRLQGRERAAWLCLGTTLILWAAGDFYYTLFLWDATVQPPTVTDWLWLASYPFFYAAIALLVRARACTSSGVCGSTPPWRRSRSRPWAQRSCSARSSRARVDPPPLRR